MITSEQVDKIFPAIIKAQSIMGNAKKTCDNPFFKSKYADLSEIIEVTKEVLSANGLGVIQSPGGNGNQITVTARIIHESGQWIEDTLTLNATKSDPQQAGSAITYGRRYQLAALFNIAQEDDDGNSASKHKDDQSNNPQDRKKPDIDDAEKARRAALSKRFVELLDTKDENQVPLYDKAWREKWNARLKEVGYTATIKEIEADLGGNK